MPTTNARGVAPITIPQMAIRSLAVRLIGDSPLICHAWSHKAKQQMLDKQMKKAKEAKQAKEPFRDFCESLYWMDRMPESPSESDVASGRFGFPVVAFKSAAVDACSHIAGITKVEARGAFHIAGDLVRIEAPAPTMREDMVRIAMGTADIRHRAEFATWAVTLPVRYNAAVLSDEQITHLFNTGGFAIGVGEWRPQKDGSFGMFHVANPGE